MLAEHEGPDQLADPEAGLRTGSGFEAEALLAGEFWRAALLSAITELEAALRDHGAASSGEDALTLRQLVRTADLRTEARLRGRLHRWVTLRNAAVHDGAGVRPQDARSAVADVAAAMSALARCDDNVTDRVAARRRSDQETLDEERARAIEERIREDRAIVVAKRARQEQAALDAKRAREREALDARRARREQDAREAERTDRIEKRIEADRAAIDAKRAHAAQEAVAAHRVRQEQVRGAERAREQQASAAQRARAKQEALDAWNRGCEAPEVADAKRHLAGLHGGVGF